MLLRMRIAGLLGGMMGAVTLPLLLWNFGERIGAPEWMLPFCWGCAVIEGMYLIEKFRKGE